VRIVGELNEAKTLLDRSGRAGVLAPSSIALRDVPMERERPCAERGFLGGNRSPWPNNLGYCQEVAEVGVGPRRCVHLRTNSNTRSVRVRSYGANDQSSWRLDLACHVLPATSDDFMAGKPERDDFLGTPGHDGLASSCIFAFSIGVAASLSNSAALHPSRS
jgi:hypothetical protein